MHLHKANIHPSPKKCNYKFKMPRKKETITLSVPPGTKQQLEAIADRLRVYWGTKPSPSGLITKIAQQEFEVNQPFRLSPTQVIALRQSVRDLIDAGHINEAQSVLTLLIDRAQLETPLRQDLMRQVSQPLEGWRPHIDQLINNQQSFQLVYQNSQSTILEFTVRYAEVIFYEKRQYLEVWCEETADSTNLPDLLHNRCLRFDRIQAVLPLKQEWRGHFDSINAIFHLTGWLRNAYEAKPNDIGDEPLENARQITRRIINPFWFFREILPYGDDCELISPPSLRQQFQAKIQAIHTRYSQ
jgi:predicted DNA-binding transcriptional regulator YafY